MSSNRRTAFLATLLIALTSLGGCTATPASKVSCESNLRPINPANLEHAQP